MSVVGDTISDRLQYTEKETSYTNFTVRVIYRYLGCNLTALKHGLRLKFLDVQAMKLIQSRNASPTLQQLVETFRFPLDDFQKEAIQEFLNGHSVLVCAPTGAGKTAIAEAATIATLAK